MGANPIYTKFGQFRNPTTTAVFDAVCANNIYINGVSITSLTAGGGGTGGTGSITGGKNLAPNEGIGIYSNTGNANLNFFALTGLNGIRTAFVSTSSISIAMTGDTNVGMSAGSTSVTVSTDTINRIIRVTLYGTTGGGGGSTFGFVPYTGATANVDLGQYSLTSSANLNINSSSSALSVLSLSSSLAYQPVESKYLSGLLTISSSPTAILWSRSGLTQSKNWQVIARIIGSKQEQESDLAPTATLSFVMTAAFKNPDGTLATQVKATAINHYACDDDMSSCTANFVCTGTAVQISVSGLTANNIEWVGEVSVLEKTSTYTWVNPTASPYYILVDGQSATSSTPPFFYVYDMSNPALPTYVNTVNETGTAGFNSQNNGIYSNNITFDSRYMYYVLNASGAASMVVRKWNTSASAPTKFYHLTWTASPDSTTSYGSTASTYGFYRELINYKNQKLFMAGFGYSNMTTLGVIDISNGVATQNNRWVAPVPNTLTDYGPGQGFPRQQIALTPSGVAWWGVGYQQNQVTFYGSCWYYPITGSTITSLSSNYMFGYYGGRAGAPAGLPLYGPTVISGNYLYTGVSYQPATGGEAFSNHPLGSIAVFCISSTTAAILVSQSSIFPDQFWNGSNATVYTTRNTRMTRDGGYLYLHSGLSTTNVAGTVNGKFGVGVVCITSITSAVWVTGLTTTGTIASTYTVDLRVIQTNPKRLILLVHEFAIPNFARYWCWSLANPNNPVSETSPTGVVLFSSSINTVLAAGMWPLPVDGGNFSVT